MKIWISVVLASLLTVGGPVQADPVGLNYNLVNLSADAVREVPNDLGTVVLQARHQARDAKGLPALVNRDMNWALDLAREVKEVKVQTRQYSTQPHYESGRIVGWTATQTLYLESTDLGALGDLVTALQDRLAVEDMGFVPSRSTAQSVEDELTREAIAAFRAKAELIASALGAESFEIVNLSVNDRGAPAPRRAYAMAVMAEAADAPVPVAMDAGTATLTIAVNGQIQLR